MIIQDCILHIIGDGTCPTYSCSSLLTNEWLTCYFSKILEKAEQDPTLRRCTVSADSPLTDCVLELSNEFINGSVKIARLLAERASQFDGKFCFDMAAVRYGSIDYPTFAILLLRYRDGYIHRILNDADKVSTEITHCSGMLPGLAQKADVVFIYDSGNDICRIIDKELTNEENKQSFLSPLLGETIPEPNLKESIAAVQKTAKEIIKDSGKPADYTSDIQIQGAIASQMEESGTFDPFSIGNILFENEPELKTAYENIIRSEVASEPLPVSCQRIETSMQRLKFKTDTGIELTIPLSLYNQVMHIENRDDGTISVLIDGINELRKMS